MKSNQIQLERHTHTHARARAHNGNKSMQNITQKRKPIINLHIRT